MYVSQKVGSWQLKASDDAHHLIHIMCHECLPNNSGDDVEDDGNKNEKIIPIKSFETLNPGPKSETDENHGDHSSAPHDTLDHLSFDICQGQR